MVHLLMPACDLGSGFRHRVMPIIPRRRGFDTRRPPWRRGFRVSRAWRRFRPPGGAAAAHRSIGYLPQLPRRRRTMRRPRRRLCDPVYGDHGFHPDRFSVVPSGVLEHHRRPFHVDHDVAALVLPPTIAADAASITRTPMRARVPRSTPPGRRRHLHFRPGGVGRPRCGRSPRIVLT